MDSSYKSGSTAATIQWTKNSVICFIVVVVMMTTSQGREVHKICPDHLHKERLIKCLTPYENVITQSVLRDSKLLTGVDTEEIRNMCSHLSDAIECVRSMRKACPTDTQQMIDRSLRKHAAIIELCNHNLLFEEYSMNKNCFYNQRRLSKDCYERFKSHATLHTLHSSNTGSRRSTSMLSNTDSRQSKSTVEGQDPRRQPRRTVAAHCKRLVNLKTCVRDSVHPCFTPVHNSTGLTDLLVDASLNSTDIGDKCKNDTDRHHNTITTSGEEMAPHRRTQVVILMTNGAAASSKQSIFTTIRTLLIMLIIKGLLKETT